MGRNKGDPPRAAALRALCATVWGWVHTGGDVTRSAPPVPPHPAQSRPAPPRPALPHPAPPHPAPPRPAPPRPAPPCAAERGSHGVRGDVMRPGEAAGRASHCLRHTGRPMTLLGPGSHRTQRRWVGVGTGCSAMLCGMRCDAVQAGFTLH